MSSITEHSENITTSTSTEDNVPSYCRNISSPAIFQLSCGHTSSRSATIVEETGISTQCEDCYQVLKPRLAERALNRQPLQELECMSCGRSRSRFNPDIQMSICDSCRQESQRRENEFSSRMPLRSDILPDLLSSNALGPELYIGAKEAAMAGENLRGLNIGRVLVCCSHLPEYLAPDASVQYHRLPMADSLDQDLKEYLPSALAFIADGVREGHATLVHCNAGVSRSGSVAVAWLMATRNLSLDDALAEAKLKRPIITPNSNFIEQLRSYEQELRKLGSGLMQEATTLGPGV